MKIFYVCFLLALSACGGSDGCKGAGALFGAAMSGVCSNNTDSSSISVATGYFKDSAVEGLSYVSGLQSGFTGPDGSFKYEVGKPVTFKIGGMTLGTVLAGSGLVTPIDLVANGSIFDQQVVNITSFLMAIDNNKNPDDGIQIPALLRDSASILSQSQLDFNQPFSTFSSQATLLTGLDLPSQTTAVSHLTGTLRCIQSGVFKGSVVSTTLPSTGSGTFGVYVDVDQGFITGVYAGFQDGNRVAGYISGVDPISFDQKSTFVSGIAGSNGATYSGNLISTGIDKFNSISGGWKAPAISDFGTFSGGRLAGDIKAKYRISGFYQTLSPDYFLYAIDVNATGVVSGKLHSMNKNLASSITGLLSGAQITATTSSGENFQATINIATGAISNVRWSGGGASSQVGAGYSGCLLNGFVV